ncbi:MAG: hypothetical protein WBG01_17230 [Bacteroidota bacterium]
MKNRPVIGRLLYSILLVSAVLATLTLTLGVQWLHNDYGLPHEREDCPSQLITYLLSSGIVATGAVLLIITQLGAVRFSTSCVTLPVFTPRSSSRGPPR